MVVCLERGADCLHVVQLMPLRLKTSLASFKSRLVLSFWYWLTQVVLEKKPLHGCSGSIVNLHLVVHYRFIDRWRIRIRSATSSTVQTSATGWTST